MFAGKLTHIVVLLPLRFADITFCKVVSAERSIPSSYAHGEASLNSLHASAHREVAL